MNFRDTHTGMLFAFLIYVLMSSFTILNMLIGVLCEVVSAVPSADDLCRTHPDLSQWNYFCSLN